MNEKQPSRGGVRPGSGRKAKNPADSKQVGLRMTPWEAEKVREALASLRSSCIKCGRQYSKADYLDDSSLPDFLETGTYCGDCDCGGSIFAH